MCNRIGVPLRDGLAGTRPGGGDAGRMHLEGYVEVASALVREPRAHGLMWWLSPRSPPGLQYASGRRQSAASQSAPRFVARCRICGDGGISGLGGCKIGSRPGLVQAGNAGPRSL